MGRVTYVESNGAEHTVEVPEGTSVMQGAIDNQIDGILAECGGAMACGTCHCYIDDAWADKTGEASDAEKGMLEFTSSEARPTSRLSCQIDVTAEMDGLIVHMPESQF